jgi:hypothetical protein
MNIKESQSPVPTPEPAINYATRPESIIVKAEINRSNLPLKQVILSNIPEFCLYGNKTLIYRVEGGKKEIYSPAEKINYPVMKKVTLKEKNIQELLKFIIEEKKFFSLKGQKKEKKNMSYSLTVNIEKSGRTVSFYDNNSKELKDTYNLLKNYDIKGSEPYRPQQISIAVYNVPDYIEHCTRKATMWTCKDIVNLEKLSGKYVPEDIQGKKLDRLLDFFTKYSPNDYFYFQGEKVYGIFCRPCLPHEIIREK